VAVTEAELLALPLIYLNGGRRGLLLGLTPDTLVKLLDAKPVQAANDK